MGLCVEHGARQKSDSGIVTGCHISVEIWIFLKRFPCRIISPKWIDVFGVQNVVLIFDIPVVLASRSKRAGNMDSKRHKTPLSAVSHGGVTASVRTHRVVGVGSVGPRDEVVVTVESRSTFAISEARPIEPKFVGLPRPNVGVTGTRSVQRHIDKRVPFAGDRHSHVVHTGD